MRHRGSVWRRSPGQLSDLETMRETLRLSRGSAETEEVSSDQQPEEQALETTGGEILGQVGLVIELNPEADDLPPAA